MNAPATNLPKIAFIGFGEAGMAIASGWRADYPGIAISAYDIKTDAEDTSVRDGKLRDYDATGINGCLSLAEALSGADAIVSTVTADRAFEAASAAAPHLSAGQLFLDMNSCAPQTKQKSSGAISAQKGRYVDVAVMAPIHPKRHQTAMLIAGPHAEAALSLFTDLGGDARIVGDAVGAAGAIKMIRSIFVKGLEALTLEGVLAGEKLGVTQQVLESLEASYPGFGWAERAGYNLERSTTHGIRRAAELEEVVVMLDGLGVGSDMARSIAARQLEAGRLGIDAKALKGDGYAEIAAAILNSPKWRSQD